MKKLVAGIFSSRVEVKAVGRRFKQLGFGDDFWVIARNNDDGRVRRLTAPIKPEKNGAHWGLIIGSLGGLLLGAFSLTLPGAASLLVVIPISALLGAAGGIAGAAVGFLIAAGLMRSRVNAYAQALNRGEVMVLLDCEEKDVMEVLRIMETLGAVEMRDERAYALGM